MVFILQTVQRLKVDIYVTRVLCNFCVDIWMHLQDFPMDTNNPKCQPQKQGILVSFNFSDTAINEMCFIINLLDRLIDTFGPLQL